MPKPLIVFHANCSDGHTAAWVAARALGDADLHAAQYGSEPPEVRGRDVYILDFSYARPVMQRIARAVRRLVLLDHHRTAHAELIGLNQQDAQIVDGERRVTIRFDLARSGAGLAWQWFHPSVPAPWLVRYVEDQDLWRWALPNSRLIGSAVESYPRTLETWDDLALRVPEELLSEGMVIHRYRTLCVEAACRAARLMPIAGQWVPAANSSEQRFASDTAHELSRGFPFAATYWIRNDGLAQFSLRSHEDGADVSAIAVEFGGGGHAHAAGFEVSREHLYQMLDASRPLDERA
jgi:oligoribonuclease NrnB/cAMP/cGMP phosphodiesterase (DHH superfamily)